MATKQKPPSGLAIVRAATRLTPSVGTLLLLVALIFALTGCEKAAGLVVPVPQVIEKKYEFNFLSANQVHLTIRNTGISGRFVIVLSQDTPSGRKEWTERAYFNANEQRTVSISVPGNGEGDFSVSVKPE